MTQPASWLGEVPANWSVKRLKYVSSINDEALPETTDPEYELLYVDIGSVDATEGIQKKEPVIFENAPSRARRIVRDGDTIVSTVRTYLRAVAPIEQPEENLVVSTGFAVVRPSGAAPRFLAYCLRSSYFIETVVSRSVGVSYPATNPTDVSCIEVPLPPIEEQKSIARFLDAKTAQIDTLVAKKRQLIDKLKEKRSALIARTVTRGLPPEAAKAAGLEPNPEMMDSGEGWIGEMPSHWAVRKGSRLGRLIGSVAPSEEDIIDDEEGVPYAKVDDLNYLDSSLQLTATKARVRCATPRWKSIILFPKRGAAIFTNKVALAACVIFDSNLMGWEINEDSDSKFIAYCLIARRLDDLADVSTVPQINNKHIYPAKFPHPSRQEQEAIVAFLDREIGRIDQLVGRVEDAITCLTEYRQALITSAVTGKIDVRGWQAEKEAA